MQYGPNPTSLDVQKKTLKTKNRVVERQQGIAEQSVR